MHIMKKIKDKALPFAVPYLSESAAGRWVMQRLIKSVSSKLGVEVNASYDKEEKKWFVHAGGESALYVHVSLTANGLAYAAKRILPALDKPEQEKQRIIQDTLFWLLTSKPE